jgi:hypothetical protein
VAPIAQNKRRVSKKAVSFLRANLRFHPQGRNPT